MVTNPKYASAVRLHDEDAGDLEAGQERRRGRQHGIGDAHAEGEEQEHGRIQGRAMRRSRWVRPGDTKAHSCQTTMGRAMTTPTIRASLRRTVKAPPSSR